MISNKPQQKCEFKIVSFVCDDENWVDFLNELQKKLKIRLEAWE